LRSHIQRKKGKTSVKAALADNIPEKVRSAFHASAVRIDVYEEIVASGGKKKLTPMTHGKFIPLLFVMDFVEATKDRTHALLRNERRSALPSHGSKNRSRLSLRDVCVRMRVENWKLPLHASSLA
jgi:hypothetical protein